MTEALTNDLSDSRNEIMNLRRELENRNYLRTLVTQHSQDQLIIKEEPGQGCHVDKNQRNQHQKARWACSQ